MSSAIAAPCEPDDSDARAWDAAGDGCAAPSAERRLRMLDRLAEAGLQIALVIERRVKHAPADQPIAELNAAAMAYARAARAVRLAVLLQEQLVRGEALPPQALQEAAPGAEARRRQDQVERTVRIVRRVARDHCGHGGFALGAYAGEARERLDNDDIYGLVAARPLGELVAMICEDLGLRPDWDRLAAEAWAQAEIESGAKGSPFLERDGADQGGGGRGGSYRIGLEAEADPAPPDWRPQPFREALLAAAADPAVMAAVRSDSG